MNPDLRATLAYVLRVGPYKGKTIRDVIDRDVWYLDNLRRVGGLNLDADALCYLINVRTEKIIDRKPDEDR